MKNLKKFMSMMIAVVMMLTMAITTFAEDQSATEYTITIGNPVKGETYTAYKIFDATVTDSSASYSISKSSEWWSLLTTANDTYSYTVTTDAETGVITTSYFTFTPSAGDKNVYLVQAVTGEGKLVDSDGKAINDETGLNSTAVANLAKMLDANKTEKTAAAAPVIAGESAVTINVTGAGYYFVDTSLGSLCSLDTVSNVTINEKNAIPTPDKTTDEASKDAQIGDTVSFTVTYTDGTGTDAEATLIDTMSEGLTLVTDSFTVKKGDDTVAAANYSINTEPGEEDKWTFKVTLTAAYVAELQKDDVVTITYKATVNENATYKEAETNKLQLVYSNQTTTEIETNVTTYKFAVKKYDGKDTEKANLAGAVFQLKDGSGNVVNLVKVSDTSYRVATAEEVTAAGTPKTHVKGATVAADAVTEDFITVASGNIVIDGVDSDVTYSLLEVEQPAGYNLLTEEKSVTVTADNSTVVEVENNGGTELPSTGGIGTTLFYVIGAALVLGSGILMVSKRRMGAN